MTDVRRAAKRAYNRAYYQANRERVLAQVKAYREANLHRLQTAELERKYGLPRGAWDRMFREQGGVCAICGQAETYRRRGYRQSRLCVDHDHATGQVRGLVCMDCNRALGLFRDDPTLLMAASAYLAAHRYGESFA